MAARTIKDQFAQFMFLRAESSAANTLTFSEVAVGMAMFEYAGFMLHRAEYEFDQSAHEEMTATTDFISAAITGSGSLSDLNLQRPEVYDRLVINRNDAGAAANNTPQIYDAPIVHDFNSFPGGGKLVPAQNIYAGILTQGLANARGVNIRLWYTVRELKAQDYFELVQRLRVLST